MDGLLLTQQAEAVSVSYVLVSWEDIKLEEPGDSHELRSLCHSRPDPKICLSGFLPPACALRGTWGRPSPTRTGKYMTHCPGQPLTRPRASFLQGKEVSKNGLRTSSSKAASLAIFLEGSQALCQDSYQTAVNPDSVVCMGCVRALWYSPSPSLRARICPLV